MSRKLLFILIASLLVIVSVVGRFYSVAYLEEQGWQSSQAYPFWVFAIAWGVLYCGLLWFKRLYPVSHPVLWFVGVIPLFYGLYVGAMMSGL